MSSGCGQGDRADAARQWEVLAATKCCEVGAALFT